jgi:hypothetical protein
LTGLQPISTLFPYPTHFPSDLIARNATTKDLHLYRGNGTGGFQSGTGASFSNNWSAFDRIF